MAEQKIGNPAVVGVAGFGLTTMVLQFHNIGWIGIGPVIWLGLIFGGLAQMIAGLQEMKTGNNFGYCAFTAYGCFWIALALLLIGNHYTFTSRTRPISAGSWSPGRGSPLSCGLARCASMERSGSPSLCC